jgi:hypothetical protein
MANEDEANQREGGNNNSSYVQVSNNNTKDKRLAERIAIQQAQGQQSEGGEQQPTIQQGYIISDSKLMQARQKEEEERARQYIQSDTARKQNSKIYSELDHAAKNTCPHCALYSPLRYDNPEIAITPVPWDLQPFFMQRYGNKPGLWSHIIEMHPKVIKALEQAPRLQSAHRSRIDTMFRLSELCSSARRSDQERINIAIELQADPITEFQRSIRDIAQAEQQDPSLISVRRQYITERNQGSQQLHNWKMKNIPSYAVEHTAANSSKKDDAKNDNSEINGGEQ